MIIGRRRCLSAFGRDWVFFGTRGGVFANQGVLAFSLLAGFSAATATAFGHFLVVAMNGPRALCYITRTRTHTDTYKTHGFGKPFGFCAIDNNGDGCNR